METQKDVEKMYKSEIFLYFFPTWENMRISHHQQLSLHCILYTCVCVYIIEIQTSCSTKMQKPFPSSNKSSVAVPIRLYIGFLL